MASAFVKPLVVRLYGVWIFLYLVCAIHLEMSRQVVASIFGITLSDPIVGWNDLNEPLIVSGHYITCCENIFNSVALCI